MGFTALERMFLPERFRQRAANTGFSIPALQEIEIPEDAQPLVATNMRGGFLPTRRGKGGQARFGFSPVAVEEEPALLNELYRFLVQNSGRHGWDIRCRGLDLAIRQLAQRGYAPKSVVVSEPFLGELAVDMDVESARRLMQMQGYVAMVDGIQVLLADLPKGAALVAADPKLVGVYTRVGNHLGLLAQRVDRAIMVVGDDLA